MNIVIIRSFFMWCTIINFGLLLLCGLVGIFGLDWAYKIHSKFFNISREAFEVAIYCFIGAYKLLFWVFCLIPYIALCIIG